VKNEKFGVVKVREEVSKRLTQETYSHKRVKQVKKSDEEIY